MRNLILTTVLFLIATLNYAQGCSDAGICSIGNGFQLDKKELKNNIEIASIFGAGEFDVRYISPYISYTRQLNKKIELSTRITFSSANGNFGTRASFGDAFVIGKYSFAEKNNKQWSAIAGWKIPFTASNLKINGYSLPLEYQSSLGTFDLFLGTNCTYKKWDFNAVIQIPVFNNNKNSFIKDFSGSTVFPTTNLFQRKSDALFRTTFTLKTKNEKFTFKPNVLFIYHLGEDSFENIFGKRESFVGSEGLTINGNLLTTYKLNNQNSIAFSVASPFVVRDIRPDGLTRSLVVELRYVVGF